MIETGTILQNRYRVEKQIGQGGMGNVYVATDERFNSVVAIKETIFEDANLRKAFEREARLLNSLKHVALPRVSDHFDESKGQFLVMEYIAGDDLAAMMEKNGEAFPLETVLNWANQLCDALEYLHAQNIIHRDIKPQNLKLTPSGQIVLLDFGLAKGNATDSAHQTAAKSIFGFSRSYASLEQIQGAGTEPRSDLYSLGATLYHLLTGIPPADALTRAMNVLNKQSDPLVPANLVNRQIPCGVAEVLQKAMALNGNERPESAAMMRRMLDESDKTVDLFAADSVGDSLLTADFLTQETRIIGAKTNLSAIEPEGVTKITKENSTDEKFYKTAAADEFEQSKVTVPRPFAETQKPNRSKIVVGAAAMASVLLVGLVLTAVYTMSFDDAQSSVNAEQSKSANANNLTAGKSENANVSNGSAVEDNTVRVSKETTSKPPVELVATPVETTRTETREAKKPTQKAPPPARSNVQNTDSENIVVNGDTVEMGDVIIDENGIRDKKTGKFLVPTPPKPGAPPEAPRTLTPEQIRRLEKINERLEKRKNRVIVVKTPVPPEMP